MRRGLKYISIYIYIETMIYEMTRNKRNENRKTRHVLDLREREKPEQGRLA